MIIITVLRTILVTVTQYYTVLLCNGNPDNKTCNNAINNPVLHRPPVRARAAVAREQHHRAGAALMEAKQLLNAGRIQGNISIYW